MNFEEELMDILEVDELKDSDTLEDFEDFDLLTILSIIALIGKMYNKIVSVGDIKKAKTIAGLKDLVK